VVDLDLLRDDALPVAVETLFLRRAWREAFSGETALLSS